MKFLTKAANGGVTTVIYECTADEAVQIIKKWPKNSFFGSNQGDCEDAIALACKGEIEPFWAQCAQNWATASAEVLVNRYGILLIARLADGRSPDVLPLLPDEVLAHFI